MSWNIAFNKLKALILLDAILALLELQLLLMFLAQQVTHQVAGRPSRVEVASTCLKLYNIKEEALVEWIIQLHAAGLPPRIAMITEMANHLLSKQTNGGLSEASTSVGRN